MAPQGCSGEASQSAYMISRTEAAEHMADSLTGVEAGLTSDDDTALALRAIEKAGGVADIGYLLDC